MKKIFITLLIAIYAIFLQGCPSIPVTQEPYYVDGKFGPIVKEVNTTNIYATWDKNKKLYKILSNRTAFSNLSFDDIVTIEEDSNLTYLDRYINIDNKFYERNQANRSQEFNDFIIKDSKRVFLDELVKNYYNSKIDLKEILDDNKLNKNYQIKLGSPISLYPEGLYIVYYTKPNVSFEDMKKSRMASSPPSGYHTAFYRFFPADNPYNYKDIKIPYNKNFVMPNY